MKISKKDLIKLLSEHLGSDEASISSQFDKLIADIQKATNKGEKFSINGFGDFVIENGFLSFSIAPVFASEINYNYEGLMPVDIDKPDILIPSESVDESTDGPSVKTSNIVIVDEAVDGEEDPFEGLDNELTDDSTDDSTDEIPVEDEIDDEIDSVADDMDESPFDLDEVDEITEQQPKIVSADVDPEEMESLEELKRQNQKNESLQDNSESFEDYDLDEDPFADLGDEESILVEEKNVSPFEFLENDEQEDSSENLNEVVTDGVDDTKEEEPVETPDQTKEKKSLEELLGDALKDTIEESESVGGPAIIPFETSKATPSVLDEFFDEDKTSDKKVDDMEENGNLVPNEPTASDDVFDLNETQSSETDLSEQGDDETELYAEDTGGPRVVSIKEAESEDKFSVGKLLPIAAVVFIVALIAGGAWWFLMGPGKSVSSSQPQSVIVQSEPQSVSSITDNQQEGEESFPPGESIPLGSAEDDPEQPESTGDEMAQASTGQGPGSESEVSTTADDSQAAQAGIGNGTSADQAANAAEDPITQTPPSGNEPVDNSPATPTAEQNTQVGQTESAGSTPINTTFGLSGSVADLQGTVFSIIVHSLPSRQAAQIECDKISQQNLRCLVREASGPQGRRTYRVGIGQFATVDDAQSEIMKLPEPFRSRNFIARIN